MLLVYLLSLKIGPQKLNSISFLEHIHKFHLDLCSPRYSNSPQVSCLWMNPGRGWNHDLEETYLPEYSEYKAKTFTQCTLGIYIQSMKVSALEPSPISRYSESTKTTYFSILGFFKLRVKLGFDFHRFLLNQKI